MIRLQKYLADCGVASRRKSEMLMQEGRVWVNGCRADRMGIAIDPHKDVVTVDHKRVQMPRGHRYIAYYKPSCMVTTLHDEKDRPCVGDFVKQQFKERLYPVGRLDFLSEGLLLLTNDGAFANTVMHPRYGLKKEYYVVLDRVIEEEALQRLRGGVVLDGGKTAPARIAVCAQDGPRMTLRIELMEGRNRQVRRMFEAMGAQVLFLKRERIGGISVDGLRPGSWRDLTEQELQRIKTLPNKMIINHKKLKSEKEKDN